jgi:biopolymer transport protein TolR
MATVSSRGGRSGRRRPVSEINVVPYIDVMLVLLVIFMVTAPMLPSQPAAVEIPTPKDQSLLNLPHIEVQIGVSGEGRVRIRNRGDSPETTIARREIADAIRSADRGENMPVIIMFDRQVVVEISTAIGNELRRAGVTNRIFLGAHQ